MLKYYSLILVIVCCWFGHLDCERGDAPGAFFDGAWAAINAWCGVMFWFEEMRKRG